MRRLTAARAARSVGQRIAQGQDFAPGRFAAGAGLRMLALDENERRIDGNGDRTDDQPAANARAQLRLRGARHRRGRLAGRDDPRGAAVALVVGERAMDDPSRIGRTDTGQCDEQEILSKAVERVCQCVCL
jgi:hypothetical protein